MEQSWTEFLELQDQHLADLTRRHFIEMKEMRNRVRTMLHVQELLHAKEIASLNSVVEKELRERSEQRIRKNDLADQAKRVLDIIETMPREEKSQNTFLMLLKVCRIIRKLLDIIEQHEMPSRSSTSTVHLPSSSPAHLVFVATNSETISRS